jgi:NACHT domain
MRIKVAWLLAGTACVVIAAGVALLWRWKGQALGISVGLPVAATLLTPIVAWIFTAPLRTGRSTTEQLQAAAQVLVERGLEQWRTATITQSTLRGGANTLNVPWMKSELGADADAAGWITTNAARLAMTLRDRQPHRLIVVGPAGCGKTTFARFVMTALLRQAQPNDHVPVFLPLSAWNPQNERLCDWIVRRIGEEAPELNDRSSYGPTAPRGLAERHMILPILDGLDVLPEELCRSVLGSSDFMMQDRIVVTCRTGQFHDIADAYPAEGTIIVMPGPVCREEMTRYLRQTADRPQLWDGLFNKLNQAPRLKEALSQPRIIYLASAVYRDGESHPSELIATENGSDPASVEHHLLSKLVPAVMLAHDKRTAGYPWYRNGTMKWLTFLADAAHKSTEAEMRDIAWWRLYKSVPHLSKLQVPLRALLYSSAAWLVIALLMPGRYGRLTGLAYASAIFAACIFLAYPRAPDISRSSGEDAWRWWIRRAFSRSWRFLAAAIATFLGYGFFIGLRVALTGDLGAGIRTGAADGLVASLVVVLAAVIAGIPTPPRADSRANADSTVRPKTTPIAVALGLGAVFGLLAGILAVIKHQHASGPTLKQGLIYGLIMGLDFAVGTWLVRRTEAHFAPGNAPDPPSGLRAERTVALLVPAILGLTFASAFGLSARLHWDLVSGITNGLVGLIVGSLASDWPIYILTIGLLAATGKLPIRVMKFLECCDGQGIVRPVLQSYQFREDPHLIGLTPESAEREQSQTSNANYTLT